MLSLLCTEIAGSVPTWTSLQVLESEVRASENAEECPYLVDGRCPNAGTGRVGTGCYDRDLVQHLRIAALLPTMSSKLYSDSISDSR